MKAFKQFHQCLKPGGGCLVTVRDYDREDRSGVHVKDYGIREENGIRYLIFQVWRFEGSLYDLAVYLVCDEGGSQGVTHIFRSKYYAVSLDRLVALLHEAGFRQVRHVEGDYYQPMLLGTK